MFGSVAVTDAERRTTRAGDSILASADVVMDRAFTVGGDPDTVWPWLVQLGKRRAGWYLPSSIERLLPRSRRATRSIDDRWQLEQWGSDAEAETALENRRRDFFAASRFLELLDA